MIKILIWFSVILFSMNHAWAADAAKNGEINVKLRPGKSHEICIQGKKGEKIDWSFKSTNALDFDLHYYNGDTLFSPIKESTLFSEKSSFLIDNDQRWCLMWTANPKNKEASQLQGDWSLSVSAPEVKIEEAGLPADK